MNDGKKIVLIIGAGPAGLSAAWRLLRDAPETYTPVIVESLDCVGGISCTKEYHGNRIDMGGHRFFTKNPEVESEWLSFQPGLFKSRNRVSRIYFNSKLFDYPITLSVSTIKQLGYHKAVQAGLSYLRSSVTKRKELTLEDFYINRFGKVLYELFFEKYTEKLWGVHPNVISPDWGEQRVRGLSLAGAIAAFFTSSQKRGDQRKIETSLAEQFYYPHFGPGQYWELLSRSIVDNQGSVLLNSEVIQLGLYRENDSSHYRVTYVRIKDIANDCTYIIEPDVVISSMPIKDLIQAMDGEVSSEIRSLANDLPYRDFLTVGLLVRELKVNEQTSGEIRDCWIYIQEPDIRMGRIQIFNNWSSGMVARPSDTVWLGLEYFCSEGDELWSMSDEDMIAYACEELHRMGIINPNDVLDATVERVKKAYPAYFGSYEHFDEIRRFLNKIDNLYCVGRNGQHRYNNMDHSMLTSFEAIRVLLSETSDKTTVWNINTEPKYHEE